MNEPTTLPPAASGFRAGANMAADIAEEQGHDDLAATIRSTAFDVIEQLVANAGLLSEKHVEDERAGELEV